MTEQPYHLNTTVERFIRNAFLAQNMHCGDCGCAGLVDCALTDDDCFNPWHATRAAVVWFGQEIEGARDDLALAIRAYHRGFEAAELVNEKNI